jgi:hypothetical protein
MQAPCTQAPWPVYRAYSPDGLTEMRQAPVLGWRWSTTPNPNAPQGCLPISHPISAADLLNHFIGTIAGGVHVVGPMPVPAAFRQWAQGFADRANSQPVVYEPAHFTTSADTAALHIQTHNGSFIVDQRLLASVICNVNNHAGPLQGGNCWAKVSILRAPQGRLDALVNLVDSNNLPKPQENPQWVQAVLTSQQQTMDRQRAQLFAMQRAAQVKFQAMHEQFMNTMQQNFQNFQASQESKFQSFQAGQAAQRQARDNAASDWVDFALDRQTTTGAGGTVHISSQYTHTWSNGQNEWFQTNDSNANPNGVLYGNWTEDTKVHGNGQPY